jgi:two-component system, NtrC family, sensor kinase
MKRRSRAGPERAKSRRRKTMTQKGRGPRNPSAADHKTQSDVAQLIRERDEALEREKATAEVLKVISSSPGDLHPVFRAMLESAVRICEAKFGVLFRYDGNGFFHGATWRGVPPAYEQSLRQRGSFWPEAGAPLDRLLHTKQLVHTADESPNPNSPAAVYGGARSLIAVPMRKEDELVGAFVIYRTEVRAFSAKQIELVSNFAAQAVTRRSAYHAQNLSSCRLLLQRLSKVLLRLGEFACSPVELLL